MRPETRLAVPIFAATPLLILGGAVVCTWAIAHGASLMWRSAFLLLCHGIPARCLTLWNVPMPICARCVAIYSGLLVGFSSFFALPRWREKVMRILLYLAVIPMAVDGITQAMRLRESTNGLRLATGFAVGLTLGWWVVALLERREVQGFTTS